MYRHLNLERLLGRLGAAHSLLDATEEPEEIIVEYDERVEISSF